MDSLQKSTLIDLLLRSDKRRKILLFLKDGSKNIEEIMELLDSSCTAVLPQIKKLTEKGLIEQENKNYKLSTIGLIITEKMAPLIGAFEVFEDNLDYWAQKDLTGIPSFLRLKLGKLSQYKVIEPQLNRMFEPSEEFVNNLKQSTEIMYFSSFFQPSCSGFDPNFLKKKTDSTFIFTKDLFERVFSPHLEETEDLLLPKNSNLYIYDDTSSVVSLTVTERFMGLLLLNKKGKLDRNLLISSESEAIEWGKELFMYYRGLSRKVSREKNNCPISGKHSDVENTLIWKTL
ncbi:winged helix-turn-helix domain-containing protein [Methanosarcina sp.]|uniref:helix-turn-helix transcriptional regulator n=1 Tax=Methanosarcina sp. TaxID=2213 RepID=UPI002AB868D4|nr:winged helix-turn-helix domain-containing protein [Methanosarcina sp.]MDY9926589.1 winged helix-turn-helix domain-containing protein [Methanosarcina sp.]